MQQERQRVFLLLLVLFGTVSALISPTDELLSVIVVYRHGDRTPVDPYPNDPYKNSSYWPVGFGQLTNTGKLQQFQLGKWLRQRYSDFLPTTYSENDIYVRSTDADRTLMSAEANLAGLYPPQKTQMWDADLLWQPIPVHTMPRDEDALLAMERPCPRYTKLAKELRETELFRNISRTNHDLYAYLTQYSGTKITDLETLEYLYNTLFIETHYNYTLPEWAAKVYPAKLQPWADLSFAVNTYTKNMARLKTGVFFNEIIDHFKNRSASQQQQQGQKFWMFSGHDITLASLLNSMGAFEPHCPPYASMLMFELRKHNGNSTYVNLFYKNSSEVQNIKLEGCTFDCSLEDFSRLLKPITLSAKQWRLECRLGVFDYAPKMAFIFVGIVLISLLLTIVSVKCFYRNRTSRSDSYTRLPDYETV